MSEWGLTVEPGGGACPQMVLEICFPKVLEVKGIWRSTSEPDQYLSTRKISGQSLDRAGREWDSDADSLKWILLISGAGLSYAQDFLSSDLQLCAFLIAHTYHLGPGIDSGPGFAEQPASVGVAGRKPSGVPRGGGGGLGADYPRTKSQLIAKGAIITSLVQIANL